MKKIFSLIILIIPISIISQVSLKKANKYYNNYNYSKVVEKLEGEKNITTNAQRNLAESYKILGNYVAAETAYFKVISANDKKPEDVFAYAQILKMNGKYVEAQKQMEIYESLNANDARVKLANTNKNYYIDLLNNKGQFEIKNLEINTPEQDFGATYFKDKIVFTSSKHNVNAAYRRWNGNNLPYLDLYIGKSNDKNEIIESQRLSKLNKKYHEGPSSYNKDGSIVMFTQDNYKEKSSDGIRKLQLIEAKFKDGKLSKEIPFSLNNKEYSVGHPSLSSDGNTLYFASDMPGGKGGVDIYKVTRKEDGSWGAAENLGNQINTEGNEVFPFIHESGLFFFSSDGRPGLGGLDVFATQINNNQISKVINVGAPINGSKDDFSFVLNNEKTKGYFASNREGGKGDDDILSFNLLKPFQFGKTISGVARDKEGNVLANTIVTLRDALGKVIAEVTTDEKGGFIFAVEANKEYDLNGKKENYFDGNNHINTASDSDTILADVILEKNLGLSLFALITDANSKQVLEGVKVIITDNVTKKIIAEFKTTNAGDFRKTLNENKIGDKLNYSIKLEKEEFLSKTLNFTYSIIQSGEIKMHEVLNFDLSKIEVGGDLAKMIDIKPIYFDLGKFTIRKDAALELDKIVKIMNENPNMVVELGSHTDCRATAVFNETLSDKRAKASAAYVKKMIANPERIYGKGYGESKLKNACACEGDVKSTCTEEEHQQNRRTEFIIKKF